MNTNHILTQLGLNDKEALVYLKTLELGSAPASVIGKKANLKRTTATEILLKLCQKNIAEYVTKKKTRQYSVIPPQSLLEKYQQHVYELETAVPELLALSHAHSTKPRFTLYNGKTEMLRLYEDILTSKTEVLNYFIPEALPTYFTKEWLLENIKERVKRGVKIRGIMPDSTLARHFTGKSGAAQLRDTRVIPEKAFPGTSEIYLYDNKMSVFLFQKDTAVLIEHEDIVQTQRAIFELAWRGAETF